MNKGRSQELKHVQPPYRPGPIPPPDNLATPIKFKRVTFLRGVNIFENEHGTYTHGSKVAIRWYLVSNFCFSLDISGYLSRILSAEEENDADTLQRTALVKFPHDECRGTDGANIEIVTDCSRGFYLYCPARKTLKLYRIDAEELSASVHGNSISVKADAEGRGARA